MHGHADSERPAWYRATRASLNSRASAANHRQFATSGSACGSVRASVPSRRRTHRGRSDRFTAALSSRCRMLCYLWKMYPATRVSVLTASKLSTGTAAARHHRDAKAYVLANDAAPIRIRAMRSNSAMSVRNYRIAPLCRTAVLEYDARNPGRTASASILRSGDRQPLRHARPGDSAALQLRENNLGSLGMSICNEYARAAAAAGIAHPTCPRWRRNGGEDTFRIQARLQMCASVAPD